VRGAQDIIALSSLDAAGQIRVPLRIAALRRSPHFLGVHDHRLIAAAT
jgi:hypothetical protein